jgi:hypothetical protein
MFRWWNASLILIGLAGSGFHILVNLQGFIVNSTHYSVTPAQARNQLCAAINVGNLFSVWAGMTDKKGNKQLLENCTSRNKS